MALQSIARISTCEGSRYLTRLCQHWSHNLAVEYTPTAGTVVFPRDARGASWPGTARLPLAAHEDALECRLESSAEGQHQALKQAIARHLDRFAFREGTLAFGWQDL